MAEKDVYKLTDSIKAAAKAAEEVFTKGSAFQRWKPPMETDSSFGEQASRDFSDQLKTGFPDKKASGGGTSFQPDKLIMTGNSFYFVSASKAAWTMYARNRRDNAAIGVSIKAGLVGKEGEEANHLANLNSMTSEARYHLGARKT
jgi:hypothetical protein